MTRPKRPMTPAVIDACCLIDLLSSGQAAAILRAAGHAWHLPDAVQGEVQYVRQHDPAQPGGFLNVPADLTPLIASGLLTVCHPDDPQEQARFVHHATIFRSDGEAMCLALAESRGWMVASDDRKAIRVAGPAGLTVPENMISPSLLALHRLSGALGGKPHCEPTTHRKYVSAGASLSLGSHEPPAHRSDRRRSQAPRPRLDRLPHAPSGSSDLRGPPPAAAPRRSP